nr:MAG TPA: hypothetical protein [Caudoviricetes sp.]
MFSIFFGYFSLNSKNLLLYSKYSISRCTNRSCFIIFT